MGIVELKKRLHEQIDDLNDDQLQETYGLINNYLNSKIEDFKDEMTPKEKASIEKGLAQIEAGQTIPHEHVMSEFRQKLTK